jgi:hypothetical protein
MLKWYFSLIKLMIFAIIILILGVTLQWNGKSLSDHVQAEVEKAKTSNWYLSLKIWSKKITQEAYHGFQKQLSQTSSPEQISDVEKDKLKNLMKELNETPQKN